VKGLDDHAKLSNHAFDALIAGLNNQTRLLDEKLNALIANSDHHSQSSRPLFVTGAMRGAVMHAAERDRKFIARPAAQRARLQVAQMMRVRWLAAKMRHGCCMT
jgi:hypothetical protein